MPLLCGVSVTLAVFNTLLKGFALCAPAAVPAAVGIIPVVSNPATALTTASAALAEDKVLAKPPIRKLARDLNVDITKVRATGPGGEVLREDILAGAEQASVFRNLTTPDVPQAREERIPVKGVRKAIANAMVSSAFTAPHVSIFVDVDATRTMEYVKRLKASTDFAGVKVTPLLIMAKAMIWAVRRNPMVNSTFTDEEIIERPWLRPGKWYVVHSQSGYEKKAEQAMQARVQTMHLEQKIYEIVIPMEDVVEFKNGRKQTVQKKMFPGYILVRCELDDESWLCVRQTPGITGFVGQNQRGQRPTPLSKKEVQHFFAPKEEGEVQPKRKAPKMEYDVGEAVRVKEGPFADFQGQIAEINGDHMKLKVLVNIFGRDTLVEMDFGQVAKL